MRVENNYDLAKLNTFGIKATAKLFVEINNESDLSSLFLLPEFKQNEKIFLGGGSNVLFTKNFDGIVILNKLKGIEIEKDNSETVMVRAMSGEIWHELVMFSVGRGYWGIENLSLIPGTVGAAPIQNIGAYGAELKDTLVEVEAYQIKTSGGNNKRIFSKEECEFGYRDSIFKNILKDQYFISAVTLKLSKVPKPNLSYKILQDFLEKNNIEVKSSKDVSDAVAEIRRSKLPDPKIIGNAGSFFKNVFVTKEQLQKLQEDYPAIPYFEEEDGSKASVFTKIPAGWLIKQCGWKGKRVGNVGVHEKQALVLVNYGGATGGEIVNLANEIMESVKDKFGMELAPEVNLI